MHVLHVQGSLHEQLDRDPRVPHPAGDRARAAHGRQLLGLLKETKKGIIGMDGRKDEKDLQSNANVGERQRKGFCGEYLCVCVRLKEQ